MWVDTPFTSYFCRAPFASFFYFLPLLNYFSKLKLYWSSIILFTFPWYIEWCSFWKVKSIFAENGSPRYVLFYLNLLLHFLFCVQMWIRGAYTWPILQCLVWYATCFILFWAFLLSFPKYVDLKNCKVCFRIFSSIHRHTCTGHNMT